MRMETREEAAETEKNRERSGFRWLVAILVLFLVAIALMFGIALAERGVDENRDPNAPATSIKTIDATAVVVDIDTHEWFAGTRRYEADIELYCEEYDITDNVEISERGPVRPDEMNLDDGDVVDVVVELVVDDNTGNVQNARIKRIT